jgi:hypothetical protein
MRFPFCAALVLLPLAAPLAAQVGHDPSSSPYRDIKNGKTITALVGDIGGNGGKIGVGPHDGRSYGGRIDLRLSAPVTFGLTFAKATVKRLIVSADDSVATRVTGPVDQDLTFIEASLQLNLTGRKTWHRLAPFLSGSVGWVHGSDLRAGQDSSGFRFGNKIYLTPAAGLNLVITDNVALRLEARQMFWKLSYPQAYTNEPAAEPSTDENSSNAVLPDGKRDQWSGARELRAGLSISF